jgi:hypothetical protein
MDRDWERWVIVIPSASCFPRFISFGRGLLTCGMLILCSAALAQAPQVFVFKSDIASKDLPAGIEKRLAPGASRGEVAASLSGQPAIVLDGATLSITSPTQGSGRTLALSRLELKNGAKIVTHGINLEIVALAVASDSGAIIAFDGAEKKIPGEAALGSNGTSGLSAGTVVIDGALNANDVLRVDLSGQSGQAGGIGTTGPAGAMGPRGDNGADHLFDCARGGGNGGPGSPGGKGGRGGAGGQGGDGGRLILRGAIAAQRAQVDLIARGGAGGAEGKPGIGGPGGPGGPGGNGTTYCRGGSAGPRGAQGEFGDPGDKGKEGKAGVITTD